MAEEDAGTVDEIIEALGSDDNESIDTSERGDEVVSDATEDDIFDDKEFKPIKDDEEVIEKDSKEDDEEDEEDEDKDDKETEEESEEKERGTPSELIKEIAAKHKGIFKEYPELKNAFYRDLQFSKVFSTPQDAEQAIGEVRDYYGVQQEIFDGKPAAIVKFFESHNTPDRLIHFGRNFINEVGKNNKQLWADILFPSVSGILQEAASAAEASDNKNLAASVKHLCKYIFGVIDIPNDRVGKLEVKQNNQDGERVNSIINRQKQDFQEEVYATGVKEVKGLIGASLATLKCKPALKKAIQDELFNKVTKLMASDNGVQNDLNNKWQAALRAGLGFRAKASIIDTYLAGIKKKLPKARELVLKNNGFTVKRQGKSVNGSSQANGGNNKNLEVVDNRSRREPSNSSGKGGHSQKRNDDLRGLSDLQKLDKLIGPA